MTKSFENKLTTHNNYLLYLKNLSNNVNFRVQTNISNANNANLRVFNDSLFKKRVTMVTYFIKNITEEFRQYELDNDSGIISSAWIPTKSYYIIFHLFTILETILTGEVSKLRSKHTDMMRTIKQKLTEGVFSFSYEYNQIYRDEASIKSLPSGSSGSILRSNPNLDEVRNALYKKLLTYHINELKKSRAIKTFQSNPNKDIKYKYLLKTGVGLFDVFYLYRLKTNYEDVDLFMASTQELNKFYTNYYRLSKKFINEIVKEINRYTNQLTARDLISI